MVAWCYADSFHFVDPVAEAKAWKLNQLPYFPDLDGVQPTGPDAQSNIATVVDLMRNSEKIICAMDASGEGQLLFQDLVDYARKRANVPLPDSKLYRIWPTVKTREFVRISLKDPQPHEAFKNISKAAHLRRYIDWTAQYNYSKLYTLLYSRHSSQVFQLGRVPLLLLKQVTERYLERREFRPKPFYEVHLECLVQGIGIVFKWTKDTANLTPYDPSESEGATPEIEATTIEKSRTFLKKGARHNATESKDEAHTIANSVEPSSIIVASRTEVVHQQPPLLYNLTSLQREAYERYSIPAHITLSSVQYLYDKYGLISNPNTSLHQVPLEKLEEIEQLHQHFASQRRYAPLVKDQLTREKFENRDVRLFSDSINNGDNHAILPLALPANVKRREGITQTMELLYEMIVRRFLAAFMPDLTHSVITVTLENADQYYFEAKAAVLKNEGWKQVILPKAKAPFNPGPANFPTGYIARSVGDEETTQEELLEHKQLYKILGSLRLGEEVRGVIPAAIITKEPSPPPLYTQSRALALMEDKVTIVSAPNPRSSSSSSAPNTTANTALGNSAEGEGEETVDSSSNGDLNSDIRLKYEAGLGSPDQRADVLVKLLVSKWFRLRQDRYLEPTRKGILLTKLIQDDAILDPSNSQSWDNSLALIAKGKGSRGRALIKRFRAILEPDIMKHVQAPDPATTSEMLPSEVAYDLVYYHTHDSHIKVVNEVPALATTKCPKCGSKGHLKQGPSAYFCASPTCNFTMPQIIAHRQILVDEAKTLFQKKVPLRLTDLTDQAGNTFDATITLMAPLFQVKFEDKVITKIGVPKPRASRTAPRRRSLDDTLGDSRIVSVLSGPGRPSKGTSVKKPEKPKGKRGRPAASEEVIMARLREKVDKQITRNMKKQVREDEDRARRQNVVPAPAVRVDADGQVVLRKAGRPRVGEVVVVPKAKKGSPGRPKLTKLELKARKALQRGRVGRPTKAEAAEHAAIKRKYELRVAAAAKRKEKEAFAEAAQKVLSRTIKKYIPKAEREKLEAEQAASAQESSAPEPSTTQSS